MTRQWIQTFLGALQSKICTECERDTLPVKIQLLTQSCQKSFFDSNLCNVKNMIRDETIIKNGIACLCTNFKNTDSADKVKEKMFLLTKKLLFGLPLFPASKMRFLLQNVQTMHGFYF